MPSEVAFDVSPSRREIGVAAWQAPYHVQMIGQQDSRFNGE